MKSRPLACLLILVVALALPALAAGLWEWRAVPNAPTQRALFHDGRQVGGWEAGQGYRPLVGGKWMPFAEPPVPPPAVTVEQAKADADVPNFGVDADKIAANADGPTYWHNGRKVTKREAYELTDKGVPDDAAKARLVVIGPDADRKRVEDDWRKTDADLQSRLNLWSVPPDHWSCKDSEGKPAFITTGKPTIYVTQADGKVLHRQDDYQGPGDFTAIRKAVKAYDPKQDPDLRKGGGSPSVQKLGDWVKENLLLSLALAGGGLFMVTRNRKES